MGALPDFIKDVIGKEEDASIYSKDRNTKDANRFRAAETPVSTEQFLQCAVARLTAVKDAKDDTPSPLKENEIPLVVLAASLEVDDLKQWMCNMTTAFRYLFIGMNGDAEEMQTLLQALQKAVASPRLVVEYYPHFIGYAAAINRGYRFGLQKSPEMVPFIGVFNSDVRFSRGYVEAYLKDVYEKVQRDAEVLNVFADMVATDDKAAAAAGRRTIRTAVIPGLSYAPLLPDALRYDVGNEKRATSFSNCSPALYLFKKNEMSAFFLSRLGLSTIGFFDENYYPAYFEDFDYLWRAGLLQHTVYTPTLSATASAKQSGEKQEIASMKSIYSQSNYGTYVHLRNSVLLAATRREELRNRTLSYGDVGAHLQRMLKYAPPETTYAQEKCGWQESRRSLLSQFAITFVMQRPHPFAHLNLSVRIPPDVWILDRKRQEIIYNKTKRENFKDALAEQDSYTNITAYDVKLFDGLKQINLK